MLILPVTKSKCHYHWGQVLSSHAQARAQTGGRAAVNGGKGGERLMWREQ